MLVVPVTKIILGTEIELVDGFQISAHIVMALYRHKQYQLNLRTEGVVALLLTGILGEAELVFQLELGLSPHNRYIAAAAVVAVWRAMMVLHIFFAALALDCSLLIVDEVAA